jgi:Raf kinase inhibitor-like YbhB/YbcL family protein
VLVAPVLAAAAITLSSPSFANGGTIPGRFTCDGKGVSPPLRWTAPPRGTRSLTLTVIDPDAPGGRFVHWLAAGISPASRGLREGQHTPTEGLNGAGGRGWTGPCPPAGPAHRYVFTLTALGSRGQRLAESRLLGRYARHS